MAARYEATVQTAAWKEHSCVGCGSTYRYLLSGKGNGTGPTQKAAETEAHKAVMTGFRDAVYLTPCPVCGLIQPEMVAGMNARRHGYLVLILGLLLVPLLLLGHVFLPDVLSSASDFYPVVTVLALLICTLGAAIHVRHAWRDPNRDLASNRAVAQEEVEKGTLKFAKVGQPRHSLPNQLPRKLGFFLWIVVALFVLGIAALASAEVTRLIVGWPWNDDVVPAVVGPGDSYVTIHLPHKILSIKGRWNGTATVEVLNARELGLGSSRLPAGSSGDTWGQVIFGKDTDSKVSQTWIYFSVPGGADLAGKELEMQIDLDARYPASSGGISFHEEQRSFQHTKKLRLASPYAGLIYRLLWWGGGFVGVGLVELGGLLLFRQAKKQAKQGMPCRVIPFSEEDLDEVLPVD